MDEKERELFRLAVYDVVSIIPFGRATSYGAIAKAIGCSNMSRHVGQVMSRCNSFENRIPAHRVVNNQGCLSGKEAFGNSNEMQKLLESEGIIIINDKIQNWKKIFWDPLQEIQL